jgi:hypothetical protein
MTINPKTFELRNLIAAERPEGVKCCGVCGKPHASLTKAAKELELHKRAIVEDWAGNFRNLTRALGGNTMDFVGRDKFNAQLEWYRDHLTQAREEHDALPPVDVKLSDKAALTATLVQILVMLGIDVNTRPNPNAEDGKWSMVAMADAVQYELGVLLALKADAEAESKSPEIVAWIGPMQSRMK